MLKTVGLLACTAIGIAAFTLATLKGCGDDRLAQHGLRISAWDSPELEDIQNEWKSLQQKYDPNKDKGSMLDRMTNRLFRTRFSEDDVYALVASCGTLPVRCDNSPEHIEHSHFTADAMAFLVRVLVEAGDRDTLVNLLSTRCSEWVDAAEYVEFYLVRHGKKFNDPILILFEAYLHCKVPETREDLAAAIRRGFAGWPIDGDTDSEYVESAKRWYDREKSHLVMNDEYTFNVTSFPKNNRLFEDVDFVEQRERQRAKFQWRRARPSTKVRTNEQRLAELAGKWRIIKATYDGHKAPEGSIANVQLAFHDDLVISTFRGPDGYLVEECWHIRLDQVGEVLAIDVITEQRAASNGWKEVKCLGIYEFTGQTLRICSTKPGAERRPKLFRSADGSETSVVTLQRVKE